MNAEQITQLVAQGGMSLAAMILIGKIAMRVAERIIFALDALAREVRETGKATVDAYALLTQRLAHLEGRVESLLPSAPREPLQNAPTVQPGGRRDTPFRNDR